MDTFPDDPPTDAPGGVLAGRYRLQRRLGTGAMGVVWLAFDELLQRPVAVKQLRPEVVLDPDGSDESRRRAMREGRIAARLRHPHAVMVYDVAEHDGLPVLVMEYVPARSLAAVIRERGPMAPAAVARLGAQAASALAAAHAAGIVHRDIKPGNLLLDEDGGVKIADFGISHATGDVAVTSAGMVAGTPAYLAPEIARGKPPGPGSDVFSLGATLYAALEGRPPYATDGNALAVLQRVAAAELTPPRSAGPLTPVLTAMLAPDAARRPTATQAEQTLRGVADGRSAAATQAFPPAEALATQAMSPPTRQLAGAAMRSGTLLDARPVPVEPPEPRRRWPLLLAALVAIAVVAAIAVSQLVSSPGDSGNNAVGNQPSPRTTTTGPLAAAALTRAVSAYYALLPGQPGVAWRRLGPQLRAQGEPAYRGYWAGVSALSVTTAPHVVATDTVAVGLTVKLKNGSTVRETHRLTLIRSKTGALINGDTVTQRATLAATPRATKNNGDGNSNGNGNGNGNGEHKVKHGKRGKHGGPGDG